MGSATQNALQRAIGYLGATEIAPGRYAWRPAIHPNVESLADRMVITDAANTLAAANFEEWNGTYMPAWWTLEQRFAYGIAGEPYGRKQDGTYHRYGSREEAEHFAETDDGTRDPSVFCVTADLETGEEVPA